MRHQVKLMMGVALLTAATPALAQNRSRAPAIPTIAFGQTVEGRITAPSTQCAPDAPNVRSYRFTAEPGTRIEAVMRADDFDTLLEIGKLDGCVWTSLGSNDDGSGEEDGLNSRLVALIRDGGTYILRATSYSDDVSGNFSLALNRLPAPPAAPAPIALTVGAETEGRLTDSDARISNDDDDSEVQVVNSGRPYHLYSLAGRAGQQFELTLASDDFDSFLEAGTTGPLGYSVATSNDDGSEDDDGLDSRLKVRFESDGTIILRVGPLGSGTGAYTLKAVEVQ